MLDWLFFVVYMISTNYNMFLLENRNTKKIILYIISVVLPCIFYFFLIHNIFLSIILARGLTVLLGIVEKRIFEKIFLVVSYLPLDMCIFGLCKGTNIVWQYVILAFVIIYCIAMLTPYKKTITGLISWLSNQKKQLICYILLEPVIAGGIVVLINDNSLLTTFCLFVFGIFVVSLQWFVISYFQQMESVETLSKWQIGTREYMNTIRSQRHDFNLHLHSISGLIASKNYDKCSEYVKKLVEEATDVNEIMPIYDTVIGSMLSDMRVKAKEKGIKLSYDIKYDMKNVICNAFECNKIIGNLIQNAIDAVNTDIEKEHGIQVSIFKKRGNTIITVENYSNKNPEDLNEIFNLGYTTKKNHEGLGLPMIEKTLHKYSGKIYVEFKEQIIKFVVQIPNKISFEEE